jgi:uncharacterized protein (TIGR02594 family)
MEQPRWLTAAWAELGTKEVAGNNDNSAVVSYFRETGQNEPLHDETPWCAAFAGAMLARGGEQHTGSLLARSYLSWGEALSEPRPGAITVLERAGDPNAGHVGFLIGMSGKHVFLLGGNQGDSVSVAAFDAAHVLAYRWPKSAAGETPPVQAAGIYERALAHVLKMEGGYSNDVYDPGGPTNCGITLAEFAQWKGVTIDATSNADLIAALKRIAPGTVSAIYATRYWRPSGCPDLPAALALMHFDAAVNHGVGTAIRLLQTAVGTQADGEIGPLTSAAVASQSVSKILQRYADLRRARYRSLSTFSRFGRGWLARVDATLAAAQSELANAAGTTVQSPSQQGAHDMIKETDVDAATKWWAQSKTIWGAVITAAATVAPIVGPIIGINVPVEVVKQAGDQAVCVAQALAGLFGTILTIYGRFDAKSALVRRDVSLKL